MCWRDKARNEGNDVIVKLKAGRVKVLRGYEYRGKWRGWTSVTIK